MTPVLCRFLPLNEVEMENCAEYLFIALHLLMFEHVFVIPDIQVLCQPNAIYLKWFIVIYTISVLWSKSVQNSECYELAYLIS